MEHVEHIFFDLDRTLWDFEKNSKQTLAELHVDFGLDQKIAFDAFFARYKRINGTLWGKYRKNKITKEKLRTQRFTDTLLHFNIDPDPIADDFGMAYIQNSPRKTMLIPGTENLLEGLSKKYKLHIITNGFEEVQHIKLSNCKIDHYFDVVVCSEQVGVQKPHKKVYAHALEQSGASAEKSLMIGDDYEADVLGAHKAGLHSIWFNPNKNARLHNFVEVKMLREIPHHLGVA